MSDEQYETACQYDWYNPDSEYVHVSLVLELQDLVNTQRRLLDGSAKEIERLNAEMEELRRDRQGLQVENIKLSNALDERNSRDRPGGEE